jgi:hypothetical protein
MNAPPKTSTWIALAAAVVIAATGCATKPLFSPRTASLDESGPAAPMNDTAESPIRLVSFPSIDVLPLWPDQDEVSQTRSSVSAPLAAGAEAVKRGAGQVKQGLVNFGQGARQAAHSTTRWLSRPLVAVRATPGEPSLLQRMFTSEPAYDSPQTVGEFLEQDRVR